MNIPIPPTDSLYKYCAISGTIIILISILFPVYLLDILSEKSTSVGLIIKTADIEYDLLNRRTDRLKNLIDNSLAKQRGQAMVDTGRIVLFYSDEEIKSMLREVEDLGKSAKIKLAEAEVYSKRRDTLSKEFDILYWFFIVLAIDGIIVSVYGYVNWYKKVQVYIDRSFAEKREKRKRALTSGSS